MHKIQQQKTKNNYNLCRFETKKKTKIYKHSTQTAKITNQLSHTQIKRDYQSNKIIHAT